MAYQLDFGPMLAHADRFAQGALMTLELSFAAIALGTLVGTAGAIAASYGGPALRRGVAAYVEAIRNTPFLVQLFIIFFGLPTVGLQIDAVAAALIAMTVNLGAYATEIIRAGVQSIHRTQIEAAAALAMTRWQTIRHVVLVPAFEKVYPALASQFTLMMLTSSVVSTISVEELTAIASVIDSQTFRTFESYLVVMVLYIALALLLRGAFFLIGLFVFRRKRQVELLKHLPRRTVPASRLVPGEAS
ncbi:amino acid ABC transporter permease [Ramlibacter sp. 2FC]|uniref:amino acid ABC transporter permease n=1 Tax=Ramlibacter sp. 2FC TaxID=2502188 RepID=UPI00201E6983|nr:amino acid ABC transporter permease [Ramlibacter sp. 2FC]